MTRYMEYSEGEAWVNDRENLTQADLSPRGDIKTLPVFGVM
jgi:hypothetical protein